MKKIGKIEAREAVEKFFSSDRLDPTSVKKIKKMAMANRIRLGEYRKRFCKVCYADLRMGQVRVSKKQKRISCGVCATLTRWKMK